MQNKVHQGLIFVEYAKTSFAPKSFCGVFLVGIYLFYAVLIDFSPFL